MKNTFGNSIQITLFGESHSQATGAVLDGIAPGIDVDIDCINSMLALRRPSGNISTARKEADEVQILSGVFNGKTTGTPIAIVINNQDTRSADYEKIAALARPSHADFAARAKYHGYEDYRGGGHFSGRITAPVVAAGAIALSALKAKGILIGTHIKRCAGVDDAAFSDYAKDIAALSNKQFAVLDDGAGEKMKERILSAREDLDSVGGVLETAVIGMPMGVGEPFFDSLESVLSHALFSIPAVKGVEFGAGFAIADMKGSEANDALRINGGEVSSLSNNNGGINGGISNGMPIIFRCAVKPTPSIARKQQTINMNTCENADIEIGGRHDPCIVHRARVVVDSIAALTVCDMLAGRFGTDWLGEQ